MNANRSTLLLALGICLVFFFALFLPRGFIAAKQVEKPLIIAHRGASSLAPENTLAAVKAALELNVDLVEIDVHLTSDGELAVLHDATVNRTTNGKGAVANYTLERLKKLDAGSWFAPEFQGEPIPTLAEVLELTRNRTVLLIELKGEKTAGPALKVVEEMGLLDQVVMQSFQPEEIRAVKKAKPSIPTLLLISEPQAKESGKAAREMVERALAAQAEGIGVRHNYLTKELITLANAENLLVWVWTVDKQEDMARALALGVQAIITNRPQDLLALLNNEQR